VYVPIEDSAEVLKASDRVRAPFSVLEKLFGVPGSPGEGVSTRWLLRRINTPDVVLCVHDVLPDRPDFMLESFRRQAYYDWVVEGVSRQVVTDFCAWLSSEVIKIMGEKPPARRLTAAAREKMNALIRKGVPAGEALARVAEWELTPSTAEQFAWPVKDLQPLPQRAPAKKPARVPASEAAPRKATPAPRVATKGKPRKPARAAKGKPAKRTGAKAKAPKARSTKAGSKKKKSRR
jgi:hypothetical protein